MFSYCFHVPFQTGIRTYGDDLRHGWFPSFDEDWSPDTYTSLNYPADHFIPLRNIDYRRCFSWGNWHYVGLSFAKIGWSRLTAFAELENLSAEPHGRDGRD